MENKNDFYIIAIVAIVAIVAMIITVSDNKAKEYSGYDQSGQALAPIENDIIRSGLSAYPYPFVKNGQINTKIVIGEKAMASDVVAAVNIASGLSNYVSSQSGGQISPIAVGVGILDSDVTEYMMTNTNLITVGSSCVNTVTATLKNYPTYCAEGYQEGVGKIEYLQRPSNSIIIVVGYLDQDTQNAATVLANWKTYIKYFKTNTVCVTGVPGSLQVRSC